MGAHKGHGVHMEVRRYLGVCPSFYHIDPGIKLRLSVRFGGQYLYLLSHLAGASAISFSHF